MPELRENVKRRRPHGRPTAGCTPARPPAGCTPARVPPDARRVHRWVSGRCLPSRATVHIIESTMTNSKYQSRTAILVLSVLCMVSLPMSGFAVGTQEAEQGLDAPATLLPLDEDIEYGRLANGLTYYIRENSEPQDRAALRLVVDAGSILETEQQRGLAHFAEHMAFNGTEDFEGNEIISFMETLGMEFGPDVNAYTGFDETTYILEVPTDDAEKMESGFHVLEQWASAIAFDPEEIDSERGVILEEWRVGRGAAARMRNEHLPVIFEGSRYGDRLPIGKPEVIRNFEHELLIDYYETWYRPDLMSVIAVGDFETERIRELISEYFAPLERRPDAPRRPRFSVPSHDTTRVSVATDPEATQTRVSVYVKHDPEPFNTVGDYRVSTLRSLYSIMLNNRLSEIAQSPDAPFLQAGVGRTRIVRGAEAGILTAISETREVSRGLDAVMREARRTREHGFSESELDRAKRQLETSYRNAYEERDKSRSSGFAQEYARHFLQQEAAPGIDYEYELVTAMLPEISLEEVEAIAEEYLGEENRVVTVSAPEDEENMVPDEEEILDVLAGAERAELEPYEDTLTEESLMSDVPEPGEISEERTIEDIGVTEWVLSNGARVVVKPTDFKNDEILFGGFSPGGTSIASDEDYRSAAQAADMVRNAGVGAFSRSDLRKILAGKRVEVNPYINELTEGIEGSSSRQDLETMFQLAHLYMTDPRKDEDAFRTFMRRVRERVENRRSEPETVFFDRVRSLLFQDAERRKPLTEEKLDEITLDQAYESYNDRFSDAGDFTFFIVGSVEPSVVRPFVERYLASLPSEGREERWDDPGIERPEGVVSETVEKGIEERSRVSLVFHGAYEWSREENHRLNSMAEALERKLREIIREEEGGTYGIRVSATPDRYPDPRYTIHITFGTDPDRARELSDRVRSVIEEITEEGFESSYVERVRSTQSDEFEDDIRTNSYWLDTLKGLYFHELDPTRIHEYPDLVSEMNADSLTEAARQYLNMDRYIEVILYPEDSDEAQQ